jgi:hypothetical protein
MACSRHRAANEIGSDEDDFDVDEEEDDDFDGYDEEIGGATGDKMSYSTSSKKKTSSKKTQTQKKKIKTKNASAQSTTNAKKQKATVQGGGPSKQQKLTHAPTIADAAANASNQAVAVTPIQNPSFNSVSYYDNRADRGYHDSDRGSDPNDCSDPYNHQSGRQQFGRPAAACRLYEIGQHQQAAGAEAQCRVQHQIPGRHELVADALRTSSEIDARVLDLTHAKGGVFPNEVYGALVEVTQIGDCEVTYNYDPDHADNPDFEG